MEESFKFRYFEL